VDPNVRRKDGCGAWIDWAAYGQTTQNGYGWEIDHIKPVAKGGSDDLPRHIAQAANRMGPYGFVAFSNCGFPL
jgi:hypothetical protein